MTHHPDEREDRQLADAVRKRLAEPGRSSDFDTFVREELGLRLGEDDADYLTRGAGAPISEAEAAYFGDREPGTLPKAKILKSEDADEAEGRG